MVITCIALLPAGLLCSFPIEMQLQLFNTRLAHNFFLQLNLEARQRISHWTLNRKSVCFSINKRLQCDMENCVFALLKPRQKSRQWHMVGDWAIEYAFAEKRSHPRTSQELSCRMLLRFISEIIKKYQHTSTLPWNSNGQKSSLTYTFQDRHLYCNYECTSLAIQFN